MIFGSVKKSSNGLVCNLFMEDSDFIAEDNGFNPPSAGRWRPAGVPVFRFNLKKWSCAMTNLKSTFLFLSVLVFSLFIVTGAILAQLPGAASGDQGAGQMLGGRRGMQMDSEQMQEMMAQRYQELLGMSDEEWAVIGPYVLKVTTLSSATQSRGTGIRMIMSSRGNTRQEAQEQSQTEAQSRDQNRRTRGTTTDSQDENLEALQTLLEDENATTDEIKAKLSALRKARETAKQELATARKELRELLTLRQEATLVVMGLLE
jgi:hypothetical protein